MDKDGKGMTRFIIFDAESAGLTYDCTHNKTRCSIHVYSTKQFPKFIKKTVDRVFTNI